MIRGIHHCTFIVSNIEETRRFFCDLLGLQQVAKISEISGEQVEKVVHIPGVTLRIFFAVAPDGARLEFIEYYIPKGSNTNPKRYNVGIGRIVFIVEDIKNMYEGLISKGVKFNSEPVLKGNWCACSLQGPDGISLELLEAI